MNKSIRVILISALVIAIPVVAFLGYQYFRPPADVMDMAPLITENAQNIGSNYLADEIQSDQKYLGKTVDIHGRIADVQNNQSEGKTIYFETDNEGAPVAVLMTNGASGTVFPGKGDSVLIRAICTGFLMDVTFNRGVLIKKY